MNEHLRKLLAQRAQKAEAMKKLLGIAEADGNRGLTEDEATEYDGFDAELDAINADVKRTQKQIKIDAELDEPERAALNTPSLREPENPADIPVEVKRYSLLRAVNAQVTGNWSDAEYERECSIEIADKLGREAQGFFVPYQVQRAVMGTGTPLSDAGALVGTDHMDQMFIDSLRAESFVVANGAQVLTGLVGNIDIPRSLGGVSFTWVAEDGDATDSVMNLDSIVMSPKTITGAVPVSRRLLKQSSPAVEMLLQNDIRQGVALAIDKVALTGDGTGNKPTGIMGTTGVNTQAVADATAGVPTFAEAVGFETALADDNALRGTPIYATTATINGAMKVTPVDAGSGLMLNANNTVNGYKTIGTTLMPAKKMIFGNFSDVIIGMWGVMDIVVDSATKAASGGIVLRVFQDVDVAIRHPQSFCITA